MKTFDEIREGYVSYAQQKAAHASMAERGKKKKKEDTSDAVKAFLAKGGKIKKLPPAKAQGYHGKDDPGKDVRGMLDKPDTKKSVMGTRKKAKSMGEVTMPPKKEIMKHIGDTKHAGQAREILKKKYGVSDKHADKMINHSMGQSEAMMPEISEGVPSYMAGRNIKQMTKRPGQDTGKPREDVIIRSKKPASKLRRDAESRPTGVREISKGKLGRYLKKVPASAADAGRKSAGTTGIGPDDQKKNVEKGIRKFVNRQRGTSMAVDKMTGKAKVPAK